MRLLDIVPNAKISIQLDECPIGPAFRRTALYGVVSDGEVTAFTEAMNLDQSVTCGDKNE